ncbi:hypothetical protein [Candidatus Uabimicrobium amorphum]|uniref:hypothetical protein n=1 Tax=Uabimicrobium amorphum TaxID=2596890 RepID=UPI00125F47A6|nr:hypothetical protein [Candidatus Uabimicrobium amorphum]
MKKNIYFTIALYIFIALTFAQKSEELHVVGVYEGHYSPGVTHGVQEDPQDPENNINVHPAGKVEIVIKNTTNEARTITIALCAHEPVNWHVKCPKNVVVRRVILGGAYEQKVAGIPMSTPIYTGSFYCHQRKSQNYYKMVQELKSFTILPISSFQGRYRGKQFFINAAAIKRAQQLQEYDYNEELHIIGAYQGKVPQEKELIYKRKMLQYHREIQKQRQAEKQKKQGKKTTIKIKKILPPQKPQGVIDVFVKNTISQPQLAVLVLCAYDRVRWNIKLDKDVAIKQIILGGYYDPEITGITDDVPVYKIASYVYKRPSKNYNETIKHIKYFSQLPISGFQSKYTGSSFYVNLGDGEHFRNVEKQKIIERESIILPPELSKKVNEWLMKSKYVVDKQKNRSYTFQGKLRCYDEKNMPIAVKQINKYLPKPSHPRGLAFDSKRRKLILVTLGGVGYMYNYNVDTQEWSLVRSMKNKDFVAITYSEEEDCVYAFPAAFGDNMVSSIQKMSFDGRMIGTLKLTEPIIVETFAQVQMKIFSNYLVITTRGKSYVVNIESGITREMRK